MQPATNVNSFPFQRVYEPIHNQIEVDHAKNLSQCCCCKIRIPDESRINYKVLVTLKYILPVALTAIAAAAGVWMTVEGNKKSGGDIDHNPKGVTLFMGGFMPALICSFSSVWLIINFHCRDAHVINDYSYSCNPFLIPFAISAVKRSNEEHKRINARFEAMQNESDPLVASAKLIAFVEEGNIHNNLLKQSLDNLDVSDQIRLYVFYLREGEQENILKYLPNKTKDLINFIYHSDVSLEEFRGKLCKHLTEIKNNREVLELLKDQMKKEDPTYNEKIKFIDKVMGIRVEKKSVIAVAKPAETVITLICDGKEVPLELSLAEKSDYIKLLLEEKNRKKEKIDRVEVNLPDVEDRYQIFLLLVDYLKTGEVDDENNLGQLLRMARYFGVKPLVTEILLKYVGSIHFSLEEKMNIVKELAKNDKLAAKAAMIFMIENDFSSHPQICEFVSKNLTDFAYVYARVENEAIKKGNVISAQNMELVEKYPLEILRDKIAVELKETSCPELFKFVSFNWLARPIKNELLERAIDYRQFKIWWSFAQMDDQIKARVVDFAKENTEQVVLQWKDGNIPESLFAAIADL